MNPIDYGALTPVPDFARSAAEGMQLAQGFQQLQAKRAELEKAHREF